MHKRTFLLVHPIAVLPIPLCSCVCESKGFLGDCESMMQSSQMHDNDSTTVNQTVQGSMIGMFITSQRVQPLHTDGTSLSDALTKHGKYMLTYYLP